MPSTTPTISASMAKSWKECPRRLWLEQNPPAGFEVVENRFDTLIFDAGYRHELSVLGQLGEFVEARDAGHTRELMAAGVEVIYQAVLEDLEAGVIGRPDFLIRRDEGQYQVADAKLALSLRDKPEIAMQIGVYLKLLGSELPGVVYLGNGETEDVDATCIKAALKFLNGAREILGSDELPDASFSESKCSACAFDAYCRPRFIEDEEVTLCYGVDYRSRPGLHKKGISSMTVLSESSADDLVGISHVPRVETARRILAQAKSYLDGEVRQLSPLRLAEGTWVHFDLESNPIGVDDFVYLWGWLEPPFLSDSFRYTWGDGDAESDKAAWCDFLEAMWGLREQYADLVLVHYSHFERTRIKSYATKYQTLDDKRVLWLLGEDSPLFDIQKPILESLVLPLTGYGLKPICKNEKLVNFQWEVSESGSQWSIVRYVDYLNASGDKERLEIKNEVLSYNRDDVRATYALEQWLKGNFEVEWRP